MGRSSDGGYDLKKLFAASLEARFLVMAACSRSISEVISAMRSAQFLDRQQRQVLPDLVGDFLSRLVVVLDGHAALLRAVKRLPAGTRLANQMPLWNSHALSFGQGQIMEKLPAQMTVIGISKPGGPEVLLPETRAVPGPGPNEILIKVAAAGVNRPDVAQRSGAYPPPPGASDLARPRSRGRSRGARRRQPQAQDRRQGDVAGGRRRLRPILHRAGCPGDGDPAALSMLEAGATPETLMTVWHNVFERGALAGRAKRC
jgi:hypothetical protein